MDLVIMLIASAFFVLATLWLAFLGLEGGDVEKATQQLGSHLWGLLAGMAAVAIGLVSEALAIALAAPDVIVGILSMLQVGGHVELGATEFTLAILAIVVLARILQRENISYGR